MPNCKSNVLYKNALQSLTKDSSHVVWIGDVLIRAAAENTETFEFNRNLVLTEHCRADSVPNLEIETGEIVSAATPAPPPVRRRAAVLPAQPRHPRDQARRLVVRGFFGEVLNKITLPELKERLEAAVEAELALTGV